MEVGIRFVPSLDEGVSDALCSGIEGLLRLKFDGREVRRVLGMILDIGSDTESILRGRVGNGRDRTRGRILQFGRVASIGVRSHGNKEEVLIYGATVSNYAATLKARGSL